MAAKGTSQSPGRIALRTEANLTPKMKEHRDRFISEYLADFNGPMAYIRSGGASSTAAKMANQFLREPYVALRIREIVDLMEEKELISRKRVLAGLVREANFQGIGASHGARVAAYKALANILGMESNNVTVNGKIQHQHGVMVLHVPDPQTWEKVAQTTQHQLKEAVKV